ncbi:MAG: phosphomannomutase/phosphoglucomutase [Bacteroidales bacterium]|jgi:phosphomannomutase|nr:phosphomannomutase/phosphoglucomutase [Bacteroidales bacterium]
MGNAFKAYDIRGIYGEDFTKEDVYSTGYFLPRLLRTDSVLIGRDVRISSPEIYTALIEGITDAGADVYNMGLATTPMVYYFTAKHHFDASVQITASHNPAKYNGLKISTTNALPVGYDTGLNKLENWVKNENIYPSSNKGKIVDCNLRDEYIVFLKEYVNDFSNLNIVVDCSNGMASLLIKDILGNNPVYINTDMDGTFPNHEPNPLEAKNIVQLQQTVKENHADMGIIFDGDADRVMFVDEHAKFIPPDIMIAVLGHYFLEEKQQKGNVLFDIRTSKSVEEYLKSMGATTNIWKVGRAYAALKLREIDGIFGGELAGHYYFKDFFYSDSGILACILLLNIFAKFKRMNITVSQLTEKIAKYANSGEINFKIQDKQKAIDSIKNYFCNIETPLAFYDFDGYRIEFKLWWFNIRPSNTEPYLRFIAEAQTQDILDEKINTVKRLLQQT